MLPDTRVCKRCGNEYPLTIEYFYKSGKSNYQTCCRTCQAILKKEWAKNNRDKVNVYSAKRRAMRSEEEHQRAIEYSRKYYEEHHDEIRKQQREKRLANHDEAVEKQRAYREKNRERINTAKREYERERKKDPRYALLIRVRNVINKSFKRAGFQKIALAEEITGLSGADLRDHLLQTFYSNYGREWDGKEIVHIDHIIPISTAKTEEDVFRLCHYTNLQLLTAKDNLDKGDRYD